MKRIAMMVAGMAALMLGIACAPSPAAVDQNKGSNPLEGASNPSAAPQGLKLVDNDALAPNVPQKRGGLMTIAISEGPKTLDPYFSSGVPANHVGRPLFQTLLQPYQPTPDTDPRQSNQYAPLLAEKWQMPDDKTVVFNIRKGVKFHSGETLTADDVVFSFEYARDPKNKFSAQSSFRTVDQIQKVDDYTVTITLKQTDPDILSRFSSGTYILSKKFFDGGGEPQKTAVGTGPFRMVKFDPNQEYVSVKNENYWDSGKPFLDGFRHIQGLERSAILAAFTTGKVDYYNVTDKVQFDEFKKQQPQAKSWAFYTGRNYGWYPNLNTPALKDIRVRRAMQLTIDRQAINESVAFGLGLFSAPGDAGFLGAAGLSEAELFKMPGWRQPKDQDIADAKKLMQEAGFPNGFKIKGVYISSYTTVPQIAELIANQWKTALNIQLDLAGMDTTMWSDAVEKKGDFDLAMGNTRIIYPPDTNLTNYWSSTGSFNRAAISNPKMDELIVKQKTIVDPKERVKVWAEISKIITDEVYYMPSVDGAYFGILQPWVNGIYPNYSAQPWLPKPAEVWFDTAKQSPDRAKSDADLLKALQSR